MDWFSDGLCAISGRGRTTSPRSSSTRFSSQAHPQTKKDRNTVETFLRWQRRTLDLPGPYYLEVFDWLFRENRIAAGRFRARRRKLVIRL